MYDAEEEKYLIHSLCFLSWNKVWGALHYCSTQFPCYVHRNYVNTSLVKHYGKSNWYYIGLFFNPFFPFNQKLQGCKHTMYGFKRFYDYQTDGRGCSSLQSIIPHALPPIQNLTLLTEAQMKFYVNRRFGRRKQLRNAK